MEKQLLLYPNPTTHSITIQKPKSIEVEEIKIYNSLGQILLITNWKPNIDLSTLSSGLFIVQFQTNQGVINKMVLKN